MSKNEFDELDVEEFTPEPKLSSSGQGDSLIASGNAGVAYDWTKAPDGIKAPPRINLDGKNVKIKKADIILPPVERPWEKTKAGDKFFKYCTFTIYYDEQSQQENYSGVRVFQREENGEYKYSHPTITRDRKNQASNLLGIYADFKKKDINEVTLREFLGFLNSEPNVIIIGQEVKNPETGEVIVKNIIKTFVN